MCSPSLMSKYHELDVVSVNAVYLVSREDILWTLSLGSLFCGLHNLVRKIKAE